MSAAELQAELEQRLRDDPEYRAHVKKADAERVERTRLKREAERPVLDELRASGIEIDSLWNLYKTPEAQLEAAPTLIRHLSAGHPDSTIEAIAAAIGVEGARDRWADLVDLYVSTSSALLQDRLASVLSQAATREHLDQLVGFVEDEALGESRIYHLRPINRIGNRKSLGAGRAVVTRYVDDPVLGREAAAILAGKGPKD